MQSTPAISDNTASTDPNAAILDLAHRFIELTSQNLFITGKAGSGKTYFLTQQAKKTTKKFIILAPTGIAAVNAGGVTINSIFQVPPGTYVPDETTRSNDVYGIAHLVSNLNYTPAKKRFFQNLELIFIDEVSMLRSDQVSLIDAILKKVRNNDLPFGGIQIVFIGDLFQLPPVLPNELVKLYTRHYESEFFFDSDCVKRTPPVQIELPFVHRQADARFIDLLNRVRTNQLTPSDLSLLNKRFVSSVDERFVTYLTSHIEDAIQLNNIKLDELQGEEFQYPAIVTGDFNEGSIAAERTLKLKKGAQVMLIRNDAKSLKDYHNGKIGEVLQMTEDTVVLKFEDGREVEIGRTIWQSFNYNGATSGLEVTGEFKQFPLKLAWAVTIHKSQGLTFERAAIDAAKSFASGQVYVALSRVRSFQGLYLISQLTSESIRATPKIISYLQSSESNDLAAALNYSKVRYWLNQVLTRFDVTPQLEEVKEIVNGPNTFKQKLDMQVIISLQDAGETLNKLQSVQRKFSIEILDKFKDSIDIAQLSERVAKASGYFKEALSSLITKMNADAVGKNDLSVSLMKSIETSLAKRVSTIEKSQQSMTTFATNGIDTAIAEGRSDQHVPQPDQTTKQPQAKKRNSNQSISQTVDLFHEGRATSEIAELRKISVGTVENHVLEAIRRGDVLAKMIVEDRDLKVIQDKIKEVGSELSDLKEFFADRYTFFQLRIAIADSNINS